MLLTPLKNFRLCPRTIVASSRFSRYNVLPLSGQMQRCIVTVLFQIVAKFQQLEHKVNFRASEVVPVDTSSNGNVRLDCKPDERAVAKFKI